MSTFTEPLTVTKISSRLWKVARQFEYHIGTEESEEVIIVPEGFLTDFASSPRFTWIIIPPDGIYTQSAVLHDFCYSKKLYTRKKCDYIFYESMGVLGVPQSKRWIMWKSVRLFGKIGWNAYRRKDND